MRVLGIDPGSTATGYGILEDRGNGPKLVACGVIRAGRGPLPGRLGQIFEQVDRLLADHRPDAVAVEEVFFARNPKSALVLGQARGAALAAVGRREIEVFEYPARRIKQTVTGHGGADKQQVQTLLRATLGQAPEELDASDAVAVALCHMRFCTLPQEARS